LFAESGTGAIGYSTRFWGFSRVGKWFTFDVAVRYQFQIQPPSIFSEDPEHERLSEIVSFVAKRATPGEVCTFCNVSPKVLCDRFSSVTEEWVNHRELLLSEAMRISGILQKENVALSLLK